jgi:tripartite-type tricarboxylate transporter receptor subunit TctC
VTDLIDHAKREPGKIDIAHAGVGNPFHLAAVLFQQAAGIKLNEVPYRGAGPHESLKMLVVIIAGEQDC